MACTSRISAPRRHPTSTSALTGRAEHLCSRLQLLAGRTGSLLDVGHNACSVPRALIVARGLCVPTPEYLQQPAGGVSAACSTGLSLSAAPQARKETLQSSGQAGHSITFRVGKPWTPYFVARSLFTSSVASTCTQHGIVESRFGHSQLTTPCWS